MGICSKYLGNPALRLFPQGDRVRIRVTARVHKHSPILEGSNIRGGGHYPLKVDIVEGVLSEGGNILCDTDPFYAGHYWRYFEIFYNYFLTK